MVRSDGEARHAYPARERPGEAISRDAPFGTAFSLPASTQTPAVVGGIVEGKVTIVVLQYKDTVVGGG